jgi:hypothetical protein
MFKRTLGILTASTLLAFGCGDNQSPTEPQLQVTPLPTPTPAPNPSLVPVVTSAEPTTIYYGNGWIIRGSNFVPDPKAYFESGQSVIELFLEENTFRGEFVGVVIPPGTAPGAYTPCVETINGKGCGSFVVTLN